MIDEKEEDVAGYREAPEQQKVGGVDVQTDSGNSTKQEEQQSTSNDDDEAGTAPYNPEDDKGTPDYGSNSPDA